MTNIVYDVICFSCDETKIIESEITPSTVPHFLTIASQIGWILVTDEEEERLFFLCSEKCIQDYQNSGSLKE